jgi:hypothetical protein
MSESFPIGIREATPDNIYVVAIQLNNTAFALKSFAIAGNATFIEELINAVINDAIADTANIIPGEFLSLFNKININTT